MHGYGGGQCSWTLVKIGLRAFSRPISVELTGFGSDAPPVEFGYSLSEQAISLVGQLTEKSYCDEDSILLAHSFGAAVVIVAMRDRLIAPKHVIFVDALAYSQKIPTFMKVQLTPILGPLLIRFIPPRIQVRIVLKRIYAKTSKISRSIEKCYEESFVQSHYRTALIGTARALRSSRDLKVPMAPLFQASRLDIIWGACDPLLPFHFGKRLAIEAKANSLTLIPDCGHAPHEERPELFVQAIRRIIVDDAATKY